MKRSETWGKANKIIQARVSGRQREQKADRLHRKRVAYTLTEEIMLYSSHKMLTKFEILISETLKKMPTRAFSGFRHFVMLGITARQWTACMLICAFLSLSVGGGVGVSMPRAINSDSVNFEPVNEETSVFTSALRNLDAEIEAKLTPWRSVNWNAADNSNTDDKTTKPPTSDSKTIGDEDADKASGEPKKNSAESSAHHSDQPQTASGTSQPTSAASLAPAVPMLTQLPDSEHDSIYSYENNLGSPKGQVEMDSSNQAAALRIRHRVGIGNFSFGLPLASLSGRGIDAGVGMTYNSRTWNKSCSQYTGSDCTTDHYTYDVEQSWIAPGFSTGLGYLDAYQSNNQTMLRGVIDAEGNRRQVTCSWWPGGICFEYKTTDGSQTKIRGVVGGFEATHRDGSKSFYQVFTGSGNNIRIYVNVLQDRNGNRIQIGYKPGQSGRIDWINDTLNRLIKFYYENDTSGNPDKLVAVTIPGMGAGDEIQPVRFYYETLTLNSAGKFVGNITAPATIRVLSWVYMPATKTGYKYDHDTNYGMIRKISRYVGVTASTTDLTTTGEISNPTTCLYAASTEYNYPDGSTALTDVPKYTKRTDDWQGRTSTTPQETLYDAPDPVPGADYVSTITVKDNGFDVETETISGPDGMLKESSVTKVSGPLQFSQLMAKTKYTWLPNTRNLTRIEVTNDAGLTKATEFEYDSYNNQTKARECDYAASGTACTDATARRRTETDYETGSGWIYNNLLSLPKSVKTIVGGATVSKTLFEYDKNGASGATTLTLRPDIHQGTHNVTFNPSITPQYYCIPGCQGQYCCYWIPGYSPTTDFRGNLTKVTRFSDATLTSDPNADVSDYDYDIAGNLVSASVSCCNVKTINYGSTWSETGYAYPLSETKGSSPTQLTTSATYNLNTGLVLSSTDENNQTTNYEYETDTLRAKKTIYPNGGYVETFYSDKEQTGANLLPGYVRQKTTLETNKFAQSYSYFNGRGDAVRSTSETLDGWLISATEYDSLGRLKKSYNPFYGSTPTTAIPTGTKSSEVTAIDALGRTTEVTLQDGTKINTYPNEATVTYTAPNSQSITGTATRVKDQADKERRQIVDALGRTVRVDEPTTAGLGTVSSPNQPTYYEYDGNNNLSKVIQSDGTTTQERRFKYDSLSRLIAEKQVEADATLDINGVKGEPDPVNKFTKVLKYNNEGQLTDGYDARGVNTHFGYDGLNRVQSVTYFGEVGYETPAVTYTYDQARPGFFNNGALTKVETAPSGDTPSTKSEFDYDLMGRVRKHRQWIGTQQYDLEYDYNLAGQLTIEKYPSGRQINFGSDASGRLTSIADASRTYANNFQYQNNSGILSGFSLGNGTTQTFGFNERLQMNSQELKRGSETLQKYAYGYGQLNSSGNLDTTKNNDQLSQIESWIGTAKQWTKKFSYDSLGRLSEEKELRGDNESVQVYKNVYEFDRFGNMYRKATSNGNALPFTVIEDSHISKSTNRFTSNSVYNEAGHVINDTKFRLMGFGYDADGRMVSASKPNFPDTLSVYDAAGLRVAERVNDIWQFLVYDLDGKLVAEYGGQTAVDEGGVKYLLTDWQDSTRAVVSGAGYVQGRMDFTAYGEEIAIGVGLRTSQQGFGNTNNLRQKYGQTERDNATGLDHTWFRKHEYRGGRWTSPDLYESSFSLDNPQSFNRYSYVENEPTNFIDPDGLLMGIPGFCPAEYSAAECGITFGWGWSWGGNWWLDWFGGGVSIGGGTSPDDTTQTHFQGEGNRKGIWDKLKEFIKKIRGDPLILLKCGTLGIAVLEAVLSCGSGEISPSCVKVVLGAIGPLADCLDANGFGPYATVLRGIAKVVEGAEKIIFEGGSGRGVPSIPLPGSGSIPRHPDGGGIRLPKGKKPPWIGGGPPRSPRKLPRKREPKKLPRR